ncbi:ABC transporter substrate-binding protein [Amycolatopsis solani]|uniref:ABC transporter substrate-binding protein n=1 Tax=Amycolatopsis solani TaxID=3028615 RepID=UPI0025B125DE|nr:ABC transporter substrate-binding protein [Amycolatopsis sp. MEP2-6]
MAGRHRRLLVPAVAAVLALTSCSSGGTSGDGGTIVTANTGASGAFVRNFNPFLPNQAQAGYGGTIYESLLFFDMADRRPPVPQLATAATFSPDGRTLTVTTRDGVRWHDGQPFTAQDVAFTFDAMIKHPELNTNGLTLAAASAPDDHTAKITFAQPAFNQLWGAAGRTLIVPKHVWEKIADPATEPNPNPVGTGPFTLDSFSPQTFLLKKNPNYWEKDKPAIDGLRFISFSDNTSANQSLLAGKIDWGNTFVPDPAKNWVAKDPKTHLIPSAGIYQTSLVPNLTSRPTNDLAVRQAMNLALDRKRIVDTVYFGVAKVPSPELLQTPRDDEFRSTGPIPRDPAAARAALEKAGYTRGADGVYLDKDGQRLEVSLKVVTGYTDYIQALQLIQQQFAEVGIALTVQQVSSAQFNSDRSTGTFQLLIDGLGGKPDPYQLYNQVLSSATTAPIGQKAVSNWSRFSDPQVDAALAAMAGTDDQVVLKQRTREIGRVLVDRLPYIPVFQNSPNATFLATKVTGWPTDDNLYALSRSDIFPDTGFVAKNLKPVK